MTHRPVGFVSRITSIVCVCLFHITLADMHAQVIINEITTDGRVELVNRGPTTVDISDYWLASFPEFLRLDNANVLCDTTFLAPGAIFAIDSFALDPDDGELALFSASVFNDPLFLQDYVEWGSSGHFHAPLAHSSGQWTVGDFVFPFATSPGIEYDGNGDFSNDWRQDGESSICQENTINTAGCSVSPSELFTGSDPVSCADGLDDFISAVAIPGLGDSSAFIITDIFNLIVEPNVTWPYNFESLNPGRYYIRNLTWSGTLTGLVPGGLLRNVRGCVVTSNIIVVDRQRADGGLVLTQDGDLLIRECGAGLTVDMDYMTNSPALDYLYLLTTANGTVLASQDAKENSELVIDDPTPGIRLIYGVAGDDLGAIPPSTLISDLEGIPCLDLSNNAVRIEILENTTAAGDIVASDSIFVFCAAEPIIPIEVAVQGIELGDTQDWIIVDINQQIVSVVEEGPIDVDTLSNGEYRIHRISYNDNDQGIEVGEFLQDLAGCVDVSDPIIVAIEVPNAGNVSTISGDEAITLCQGSARVDVRSTSAANRTPYYYIITESTDSILMVVAADNKQAELDLTMLPAGVCYIYGWSQTGPLLPAAGDRLGDLPTTECGNVSTSRVLVVKEPNPYSGGNIATLDRREVCTTLDVQPFDVSLTGEVTDTMTWVLIDESDVIVDIGPLSLIDIDNQGIGLYQLSHVAHGAVIDRLEVGARLIEIDGCYSLSNRITFTRDVIDGGTLQLTDSINVFNACSGGFFLDIQHQSQTTLLAYDYLLVDFQGVIQRILDPANGPSYDLSTLPPGGYTIYGWAHTDLTTPLVGTVMQSLVDSDQCSELSSNSISIELLPNASNGGVLTTNHPGTICLDSQEDLIDVVLTGQDGVVQINFVITDALFNVIDIPQNDPPFDLDDGIAGVARIYNMAHNGAISGLEVGSNLSDVLGCYDLSNAVTIEKVLPDAGTVATSLGETEVEFCVGSIAVQMEHVGVTSGINYYYVVTREDSTITAIVNTVETETVAFDSNTEGTCRIYGWSLDGSPGDVIGNSITDLLDLECSAISSNFVEVRKLGGFTEGGVLSASIPEFLCADGTPDPISVNLSGAIGSNESWIITDEEFNIISIPFAPPFNIDPAGGGRYYIYHISYDLGISGLEVFGNLADLRGCFDLSNRLQVIYVEPDAGLITTAQSTDICLGSGGEVIDFDVVGGTGQQAIWVVTDLSGRIELLSNVSELDFSSLGAGTSRVYRLSYIGPINGAITGALLSDVDACYDLSPPILVNRTVAQAGIIGLSDGSREAAYCVGDVVVSLQHTPANPGQTYRFVITDSDNQILDIIGDTGNPVDLSDAPAGVCRIYGWSSDGTVTAAIGANVFSLEDGCSDLTNAFVSITRQEPDGASIVSTSGPAPVVCADGIPDPVQMFNTSTASQLDYAYVVTDLNGVITQVVLGDQIDLETTPSAVIRIYGVSYGEGAVPQTGDNIALLSTMSCADVSDNFITATRQMASGGTIISDMGDQILICLDTDSDQVLFTGNTASTSLPYSFIVTDEFNTITQVSTSRLIDFNNGVEGVCRVFGWSHDNATMAQLGADIGSLDVDCGDLSANFIEITKVSSGSPCTTSTSDIHNAITKVYPNPAKDLVIIEADVRADRIVLIDMTGRQHQVPVAEEGSRTLLTTSNLPGGSYIIALYTEDAVYYQRCIITD